MKITLVVSAGVNLDGMNNEMIVEIRRNGTLVPAEIEVTSDMDISSLNQSVSRPTRESESKEEAASISCKHAAWLQFKEKYKAVYDIEYKDCDLNIYQFAMSEMWSQHKILFGSRSCDDSCDCAFHIQDLTDFIVKKFISKHTRKHPSWVPPTRLKDGVGFVDRFGKWRFVFAVCATFLVIISCP